MPQMENSERLGSRWKAGVWAYLKAQAPLSVCYSILRRTHVQVSCLKDDLIPWFSFQNTRAPSLLSLTSKWADSLPLWMHFHLVYWNISHSIGYFLMKFQIFIYTKPLGGFDSIWNLCTFGLLLLFVLACFDSSHFSVCCSTWELNW